MDRYEPTTEERNAQDRPYGVRRMAAMGGSGGGDDDAAEGEGAGFQWDADSQLYYHAR